MEATDGRQQLRRGLNSGTRLRWAAAISAWVGLGLIVAASLMNASEPGSRNLHPIREVSGTISIVNNDASQFCLDTDGTGDQFCSVPYQRVGSAPLAVGEHVAGTVVLLANGPSSFVEVFIRSDPGAGTVATAP
jgi:hypothetical protein